MDDLSATLVDEVLALQAEVAALRVMAGTAVVDDPVQYINMVVENIDAFTLPLVMSDGQREILRDRLEYTRELWIAHMKVANPGGWRGVCYWLGRTLRKARRVFAGSQEPKAPPPAAWNWSELALKSGRTPAGAAGRT